jgi:hypothetical protein
VSDPVLLEQTAAASFAKGGENASDTETSSPSDTDMEEMLVCAAIHLSSWNL